MLFIMAVVLLQWALKTGSEKTRDTQKKPVIRKDVLSNLKFIFIYVMCPVVWTPSK